MLGYGTLTRSSNVVVICCDDHWNASLFSYICPEMNFGDLPHSIPRAHCRSKRRRFRLSLVPLSVHCFVVAVVVYVGGGGGVDGDDDDDDVVVVVIAFGSSCGGGDFELGHGYSKHDLKSITGLMLQFLNRLIG
ncbi:hypothetical protein FGIG_02192 [Fasciola gigantica]|uniref:Uncharacterized protein n=1 Tax=Fasciola gigantica TaxID=46835 RepID=A0A504Z4U0_FASGI|nr:hypothetical protein FGIG_02192 [Fasciola gigantica]